MIAARSQFSKHITVSNYFCLFPMLYALYKGTSAGYSGTYTFLEGPSLKLPEKSEVFPHCFLERNKDVSDGELAILPPLRIPCKIL